MATGHPEPKKSIFVSEKDGSDEAPGGRPKPEIQDPGGGSALGRCLRLCLWLGLCLRLGLGLGLGPLPSESALNPLRAGPVKIIL